MSRARSEMSLRGRAGHRTIQLLSWRTISLSALSAFARPLCRVTVGHCLAFGRGCEASIDCHQQDRRVVLGQNQRR